MTRDAINWIPGVVFFDANPVATVALDRAGWELRGASFTEVDDGDGDTPGLAVGRVELGDAEVEFGVLDFRGDSTFLLLADREHAVAATLELLGGFERLGVLDLESQLLHVSGVRSGPAVEDRVAALERQVATALVSGPKAA